MKIKINNKDEEIEDNISAMEIARKLKIKGSLAVKINGALKDIASVVKEGDNLEFVSFENEEGKDVFRHTSAHILAQAVMKLFPDSKLTIGPVVEEGFYYDIQMSKNFTPDDIPKIEKQMKEIVKQDLKIEREEVTKEKALELFKDNKYKLEMINEMGKDDVISIYRQGDFFDLCRGPHLPRTGLVKAFKLTKISGCYWRADAENDCLQRVYGISFPDHEMLQKHLNFLKEAEKRDHRKLGKQLDLFSIHDEAPGMPFFHPKGMIIWNKLMELWREEHEKAGYVEIKTPVILNKSLWETSGHWMNYRENMYTLKIDNTDCAIKPMNCPGGMLYYKEQVHSYKELPLRVGEVGLVHRHELSGVLSGLFRVRSFHQDDAHIFMRPDQIKDEILGVLQLVDKFYKIFGFEYHLELSTRPEKSIGNDEQWEMATNGLKDALESTGREYQINEGDGAFYGPKIDVHVKDCLGRTWQCATIQLDMSLPERFDLSYIGEDNAKHRPVMIHRVIYGSMERFFGILIEHYGGRFPMWFAPEQVRIVTVADAFNDFASEVSQKLKSEGFRVYLDNRAESIPKKVREAELMKVPVIITIGEKEKENKTLAVRTGSGKGTLKFGVKIDEFVKKVHENIDKKEPEIQF